MKGVSDTRPSCHHTSHHTAHADDCLHAHTCNLSCCLRVSWACVHLHMNVSDCSSHRDLLPVSRQTHLRRLCSPEFGHDWRAEVSDSMIWRFQIWRICEHNQLDKFSGEESNFSASFVSSFSWGDTEIPLWKQRRQQCPTNEEAVNVTDRSEP